MKKIINIFLWSLCLFAINSCSTSQQTNTGRSLKFSILAGANKGGITENTDMTVVPCAEAPPEATVDAFSGATYTGINVALHVNKPLKYNQIESGIDFMFNQQTFNYIDAGNKYIGVRDLNVSQIMIPLTYNFVLFRKLLPHTGIQLKFGYLVQLNFISGSSTGILPDYSINRWSNGATFGISAVPFQFKGGRKLGVYFDAYRGTQIYKDFYNQTSFEMPGSSFMKFGLKYQF
jgi:hypothetical protein